MDDHRETETVVRCEEHAFELASGTCASCRYDFCAECLVHPRGERRPPLCMCCALAAGGVRHAAARAPRRTHPDRTPSRHVMAGNVAVWMASMVTTVGGAALYLLT